MHSMLNEGVKRGIKECYHGIIDQYIMGNAYVKPDLNIAFRCFTYRRYTPVRDKITVQTVQVVLSFPHAQATHQACCRRSNTQ